MLAILGLLGLAIAGSALVTVAVNSDEDGSFSQLPEEQDPANLKDLIEGTDELDELFTGRGNDLVAAKSGDDYIDAEDGDDTVYGGQGDDQIHGGRGNDTLFGDAGDDQIFGHVGDDRLEGNDGADRLHGGDGHDVIMGDKGDDELLGGDGNDTLVGGAGTDMLQGSEGDDRLDGVAGETVAQTDFLNGSSGNDHLIGGEGDVLTGGTEADTFEIRGGKVTIMDFSDTDDDVIFLQYEGDAPQLSLQQTNGGLTLLANETPIADLIGLEEFDLGSVRLIAS